MVDIPRDKPRSKKKYVYGGLAAVVVIGITVGLARLEPAAPSVDRAAIWVDTVKRGTMVRQVRGPGTLTPENIRLITAVTNGRVERKLVEPGAYVTPETVLVEMSNPDVQRELLEAEQQLTGAMAQLAQLRTSLQTGVLNQEAQVATLRAQYRDAVRQVESNRELAEKELIAANELKRSEDTAEELKTRLEIAEKNLEHMRASQPTQLEAQASQVERLQTLVQFQRNRLASMVVRPPVEGVLQELPLEEGQWLNSGQLVARIVPPGRLKAVVRIPETQANEVVIGQPAAVDTRNGIVEGRVSRIDPSVQNGTVAVDIYLEGELPPGARPDLSVEGTIEINRLDDVLHMGRPAYGQANSPVGLFKLSADGREATRITVLLGQTSVNQVEVREGLTEGEVVILSDMSPYDSVDRVRIN